MSATLSKTATKPARYGMAIDLDRCTGCGACMIACAVENNVPPARPEATPRTGITWMRVYQISNGAPFPDSRAAFIPILCQQCGKDTPCAAVCPQEAVEVDPATGIVDQMPQRCLGCRYCMAACPYHARYFNWWDPQWPPGMEKTLNPDVATRMRGVVEKCIFCHGRLHAARARAAAVGGREFLVGAFGRQIDRDRLREGLRPQSHLEGKTLARDAGEGDHDQPGVHRVARPLGGGLHARDHRAPHSPLAGDGGRCPGGHDLDRRRGAVDHLGAGPRYRPVERVY